MPPLRNAYWEMNLMTSHGIPGLPTGLANQRAFSSHLSSIVQGRQTSNVVLPFMGNTKSFMQLLDISLPMACITPLGLESDNKIHVSLKVRNKSWKRVKLVLYLWRYMPLAIIPRISELKNLYWQGLNCRQIKMKGFSNCMPSKILRKSSNVRKKSSNSNVPSQYEPWLWSCPFAA